MSKKKFDWKQKANNYESLFLYFISVMLVVLLMFTAYLYGWSKGAVTAVQICDVSNKEILEKLDAQDRTIEWSAEAGQLVEVTIHELGEVIK